MAKDLRANRKHSIKLFADTYYIKFDIFTQSVAKLLTVMYLLSLLNKKINQTIKGYQKFTKWKFSIQGRKVKGSNRSCFPNFV